MTNQVARIPDVLLERYRLGELSREERDRLERQLMDDHASRERLSELEHSDLEIRRQHPPDGLAAQVRARLSARAASRRQSRHGQRWAWPAALAAAAAVLIAVTHLSGPARFPGPSAPQAGNRVKGLRPSLVLYRRTSQGSQPLEDGAPARAGDVVRLGYRAAGRGYGTVLSIDGRGVVTRHLPEAGNEAVPLKAGETVLLDHAYELDDAPRVERFYLVAAEAPFELEPVLRAARRAAASGGQTPLALELPDGFEQSTFSLEKEEAR